MPITTSRSFFATLCAEGIITVGRALDLGCGDFVDAKVFVEEGFVVDAVDIKDLKSELGVEEKINFIQSRIEDFTIKPNFYTFISAQMSLQFLSRENAQKSIRDMIKGLTEKGVISLTLIGDRDEWANKDTKWDSWKREEADAFLAGLPVKIHKVMTREGEGKTKSGSSKFWHVLSYVMIKG